MGLTHFDLFSGIGGLSIAAEMAGFETVGFCEYADYPYKVLCKHWPDVPKWRDIRDVTNESFRERAGGGRDMPTVISGGFPCQPHSLAGKRKASGDERDLWGEFARVIREIKPRWVVGENVVGLLTSESGRFFGRILRDLDSLGYHAAWGVWGAYQVGAIHRRDRVFIVAYTDMYNDRFEQEHGSERKGAPHNGQDGFRAEFNRSCKGELTTNTDGSGQLHGESKIKPAETGQQTQCDTTASGEAFANSNKQRLQRRRIEKRHEKADEQSERACLHLLRRADEEYISKSAILRGNDGVRNRVDRTTALGNSVCPQQAAPIFYAIAEIEHMMRTTYH